MAKVSSDQMRAFLAKSLSSVNQNKLNGLLAEAELRDYLAGLGYSDRVSPGGWILRSTGDGNFSRHVVAVFPDLVEPGQNYGSDITSQIPIRLHTICATLHQIGIHSFRASPVASGNEITWRFRQLGVPTETEYQSAVEVFSDRFEARPRRYNYLRNKSDSKKIPEDVVKEEFSKEHLRVHLQEQYLAEISDIDGVLWGQERTYPIEIKEKTVAQDKRLGPYFGLDVHPFVKLAYYAAKRGNLHSLFVVREIDDVVSRSLVKWHVVSFDRLAQSASWNPIGGGPAMGGGRSSVIKIPKSAFVPLTKDVISSL